MAEVRHWQSMTSTDAATLVDRDPVVILPVAAIEQHGPHLPLSTDLDIGLGLLDYAVGQLPDDFPAWRLPAQAIGSSREHMRFAGTLSLDPELLIETIHQAGVALSRSGVRRVVLSNSHGGNRHLLDVAGLRLREEQGLLVVKANYFLFPRPPDVELPEAEWRHGLHAGAVETAMMLHLRPDLVRTEQLHGAPSLGEDLAGRLRRVSPEAEASGFSWITEDLSEAGVVGDPRLADAAMGERLVAHYGGALSEVIEDAKAFPLDRLS